MIKKAYINIVIFGVHRLDIIKNTEDNFSTAHFAILDYMNTSTVPGDVFTIDNFPDFAHYFCSIGRVIDIAVLNDLTEWYYFYIRECNSRYIIIHDKVRHKNLIESLSSYIFLAERENTVLLRRKIRT